MTSRIATTGLFAAEQPSWLERLRLVDAARSEFAGAADRQRVVTQHAVVRMMCKRQSGDFGARHSGRDDPVADCHYYAVLVQLARPDGVLARALVESAEGNLAYQLRDRFALSVRILIV